jgi:hypothetical protein
MLAELGQIFPEVDRAVQGDLNAIAVAVTSWRKNQLRGLRDQASGRGNLH